MSSSQSPHKPFEWHHPFYNPFSGPDSCFQLAGWALCIANLILPIVPLLPSNTRPKVTKYHSTPNHARFYFYTVILLWSSTISPGSCTIQLLSPCKILPAPELSPLSSQGIPPPIPPTIHMVWLRTVNDLSLTLSLNLFASFAVLLQSWLFPSVITIATWAALDRFPFSDVKELTLAYSKASPVLVPPSPKLVVETLSRTSCRDNTMSNILLCQTQWFIIIHTWAASKINTYNLLTLLLRVDTYIFCFDKQLNNKAKIPYRRFSLSSIKERETERERKREKERDREREI